MPMLGTTFSALQEMPGGGATAGANPSGAGGQPLRMLALKARFERQAQQERLQQEMQMNQARMALEAQMQGNQLGFSREALQQKLAAEALDRAQHGSEFSATNQRLLAAQKAEEAFRTAQMGQQNSQFNARLGQENSQFGQTMGLQNRRLSELDLPNAAAHNALLGAQTAGLAGTENRAATNWEQDPQRLFQQIRFKRMHDRAQERGWIPGGDASQTAPANPLPPLPGTAPKNPFEPAVSPLDAPAAQGDTGLGGAAGVASDTTGTYAPGGILGPRPSFDDIKARIDGEAQNSIADRGQSPAPVAQPGMLDGALSGFAHALLGSTLQDNLQKNALADAHERNYGSDARFNRDGTARYSDDDPKVELYGGRHAPNLGRDKYGIPILNPNDPYNSTQYHPQGLDKQLLDDIHSGKAQPLSFGDGAASTVMASPSPDAMSPLGSTLQDPAPLGGKPVHPLDAGRTGNGMSDEDAQLFGFTPAWKIAHEKNLATQEENIAGLRYQAMQTQANGQLLPGQQRVEMQKLRAAFPQIYDRALNELGTPEEARAYALNVTNDQAKVLGIPGLTADDAPPVLEPKSFNSLAARGLGREFLAKQALDFAGDNNAGFAKVGPAQRLLGDNVLGKAVGWGLGANPMFALAYHLGGRVLTGSEAPLDTGSTPDADVQRRRYLTGAPDSAGLMNGLAPAAYQQPEMQMRFRQWVKKHAQPLNVNDDQVNTLISNW